MTVSLDFLHLDQDFVATMYMDAEDAHYDTKPTAYEIRKYIVNKNTTLRLQLAAGGGAAIQLSPVTAENARDVEFYEATN